MSPRPIPSARELHAAYKGKRVRAQTFYPIEATALSEIEGTCLAVIGGTFRPIVIMEILLPGNVVDVIDIDPSRVYLIEEEEAPEITEADRGLLRLMLRSADGRKPRNNSAECAQADRLVDLGYLILDWRHRSPDGFSHYSLTDKGEGACL